MSSHANLIKTLSRWQDKDLEHEPSESEMDKEMLFYDSRQGSVSFSSAIPIPHTKNWKKMLQLLDKDDILCDMGAGYLQFALMASQKCKKVYAVELNPKIVRDCLGVIGYHLPSNLIIVCADWFEFQVPDEATVISVLVNGAQIPVKKWAKKGRRIYHGVADGDIRKVA